MLIITLQGIPFSQVFTPALVDQLEMQRSIKIRCFPNSIPKKRIEEISDSQ